MTVKELIEILQTMPQDAEVCHLNTEENSIFPAHTETIYCVDWDEENQEVVLNT